MKKLLCEKCEEIMNGICSYDAKYKGGGFFGTSSSGKKEVIFEVEEHQCQNRKCSHFGDTKYYRIDGNAANELDGRTFERV